MQTKLPIKLPRAVGEELRIYQTAFNYGDSLYSFPCYIQDSINTINGEDDTYNYIMSEPLESDRNARIVNLLDAWSFGWEEE